MRSIRYRKKTHKRSYKKKQTHKRSYKKKQTNKRKTHKRNNKRNKLKHKNLKQFGGAEWDGVSIPKEGDTALALLVDADGEAMYGKKLINCRVLEVNLYEDIIKVKLGPLRKNNFLVYIDKIYTFNDAYKIMRPFNKMGQPMDSPINEYSARRSATSPMTLRPNRALKEATDGALAEQRRMPQAAEATDGALAEQRRMPQAAEAHGESAAPPPPPAEPPIQVRPQPMRHLNPDHGTAGGSMGRPAGVPEPMNPRSGVGLRERVISDREKKRMEKRKKMLEGMSPSNFTHTRDPYEGDRKAAAVRVRQFREQQGQSTEVPESSPTESSRDRRKKYDISMKEEQRAIAAARR